MHIERVWIDGFGRAAEVELALGPGVTMIGGLNGTGKSTLNAFIRAILFGFGTNLYPALRSGRRGGHLDLAMADGRRVRVERHGAHGGRGDLRLLEDGVTPLPGDPHQRLAELLGDANREVFESVFAFGIDELNDAARLEGGEVGARIYGASLGASRSILELERTLRDEAAQLFRPRGQRQAINLTLAELAAVESALAARDVPREYTTLQDQASALRAELGKLEREATDRAAERAAVDRLVRAWPAWTELRAADSELAAIGPTPAVQDLLTEEARLAEAVAAAETRHRQALEELERRQSALADRAKPRSELLEARARIEPLAASAAAREAEDRVLDADQERLVALTAQAARLVADLGPGWDEARLRASGSLTALRDQLLAQGRELLGGPAAVVAEVRAASASAAREAAIAEEQEQALSAALEALPRDPQWSAESLRAAVDAVDRAQLEWATARAASEAARAAASEAEARAEAQRRRAREMRVTAVLAIALVLVVAAGAAAVAGPAAGALAGLGLAALAAAAIRAGWLGRGAEAPGPSREEPEAAAGRSAIVLSAGADPAVRVGDPGRLDAARGALDRALAVLGLPPGSEPVPGELRERVGTLVAIERERAALERQHDAARSQASFRRRAAEDAARQLAQAEARASAARVAWERALAAAGLPPLDPDPLGRLLERAEAARVALRERDALAAAADEAANRRRAWEQDVRAVLEPLGYAGSDCTALIRAALSDLQQALRLDAARALAAQALDTATREAAVAGELLRGAREDYDAFLHRHGLADRADLQARHARATRHAALEQTRDGSRATIAALAGDAESPAELEARLSATEDAAALVDRRAQLDQQLAGLAKRRDELTTQLGAAEQELRGIEHETETTDLRQRRMNLLAALAEQADRYLVARLASELIAAARGRFERLHRPAVVAAAERLFVEWTGGEYAGLVVPYGERVSGARRADDGSLVRPAELSRGTREQLYLAFRFGLIEHYARQAEPLPIVMDEVLVNFDPQRAERVGRAIRDLGGQHQVLYLTCSDRVPLHADREIVLGPNLQPLAARDPLSAGAPPR
ncbi:MAG: AAA family ATPase [Candidatus Limnocylindrales bacterium]